jgi:hypothetical protein
MLGPFISIDRAPPKPTGKLAAIEAARRARREVVRIWLGCGLSNAEVGRRVGLSGCSVASIRDDRWRERDIAPVDAQLARSLFPLARAIQELAELDFQITRTTKEERDGQASNS